MFTWGMLAGMCEPNANVEDVVSAFVDGFKSDEQKAYELLLSRGQITRSSYAADAFELKGKKHNGSGIHDRADGVAIAKYAHLDCLGAIGRIAEAIPKNRSVQLITPSVFDSNDDELIQAAQTILSAHELLYDVRQASDFAYRNEDMLANEIAYTGEVSSKIALGVQRHQLCRMMVCTVNELVIKPASDKTWTSRACFYEYSAEDAQNIANVLLAGQEKISFADKKVPRVANWRIGSLDKIAFVPKELPVVQENTKQMERLSYVVSLWKHALAISGEQDVFSVLGYDAKPHVAHDATQVKKLLHAFAERTGIDSMVDALYAGVPLEDIVS